MKEKVRHFMFFMGSWRYKARRMMGVCQLALTRVGLAARGKIMKTTSSAGTSGYLLTLVVPFPVPPLELLALGAYVRRKLRKIYGLHLTAETFVVCAIPESISLPFPERKVSGEWLRGKLRRIKRDFATTVAPPKPTPEPALRTEPIAYVRGVLPAHRLQSVAQPRPLRTSEFMSLEPVPEASSRGQDFGLDMDFSSDTFMSQIEVRESQPRTPDADVVPRQGPSYAAGHSVSAQR
ncbi:MAG: hypothetical protein P4L96_07685 [Rhodoferax sp.]|nr:hypothetical protein [Rhodoferax sp.]